MDILLIIHVFITISLIGVILIQRSGQDGFGMGSGGGNAFMSARATGNFLTRLTAILATLFIANSLFLAYLASHTKREGEEILEQLTETPTTPATSAPAEAPSSPETGADEAVPVGEIPAENITPDTAVPAAPQVPLAD